MSNYQIETKCVQSGYTPENGEPRFAPIVQSTTFKYDDGVQVAASGIEGGQIRLSAGIKNVEDIIADLEQGFSAI